MGLSLWFQRHSTALLPLRHTGGALTTTGAHAHVHASAAAQLPSRLSAGQGAAGVLVATQLAQLNATHTAPLSAALAAPHALRAVRLASNAAGGGRQSRSGGSEDSAMTAAEDPFSSLTDKCVLSLARRPRTGTSSAPGLTHHLHALPALTRIPAKPVTRTETVSYGVVILAGLGVALAAAWAVLKGVSRSHRMAVRTAPGDVHMTPLSPLPILQSSCSSPKSTPSSDSHWTDAGRIVWSLSAWAARSRATALNLTTDLRDSASATRLAWMRRGGRQ